jgi:hypothetical protein
MVDGGEKIATYKLPEKVFFEKPDNSNKIDDVELLLALANLHKLNCVVPIKTMGMDDVYEYINKSFFGTHFSRSCALNFD